MRKILRRAPSVLVLGASVLGVACAGPSGEDVEASSMNATTFKATWTTQKTTNGPGPQVYPRCVYDRARKAVVYFGGAKVSATTGGPAVGDPAATYFWNGVTWSEAATATSGPTPRTLHAMAYDAARKVVVVFGGERRSGYYHDDTWEFDGTAWKAVSPPASPSARSAHAMAFDPSIGKIVLHGGRNASGGLGDTWTWDGATWERVVTEGREVARSNHAMAYDAGRSRLVVLGGHGDPYDPADAVELEGGKWKVNPAGSGGFRFSGSLVYDTDRSALVRFRGWDEGDSDARFNAHRELVGGSWHDVAAVGAGPRRDYGFSPTACVAYDEHRKVLVVARYDSPFPNTNDDVYELTWIPQANQAPAFEPVGPQRVYADDTLEVVVRASDRDDATVQLTAPALPTGATFDPATGKLLWAPTPAQAGSHSIVVHASDGHGGVAATTIAVTVLHPTIAGLPLGPVALRGKIDVPMLNHLCANSRAERACGPWDTSARFECTLEGRNPGKVAITCKGAFYVPHLDYSGPFGPALRYADIPIEIVAKGTLEPSGAFSFTDVQNPRGGRPGEYRALAGRIQTSPPDVELVITDARLEQVFGHGRSWNSGPASVWLNPL